MRYILCPPSNGGCGQHKAWRITIDMFGKRVILDCAICAYRISLPLDPTRLGPNFSGPIETVVEAVQEMPPDA